MRHPGAREGLPQRIADFALIADHQRAHLGVFGIGKIAIEERADVRSDRFNPAGGKPRTMPDDLKLRGTERFVGRGHRRVDAVARHQARVIEFAGIAVVAGKMNSRGQPDFVAQLEISAAEHCDADVAARRQHGCVIRGGAIDRDVQPIAVSFVLGLAIQMSFDRDARAVGHRGDAIVRGAARARSRRQRSRQMRAPGTRRRDRASVERRETSRARARREPMRAAVNSRGESCRARRRRRARLRRRRSAQSAGPGRAPGAEAGFRGP